MKIAHLLTFSLLLLFISCETNIGVDLAEQPERGSDAKYTNMVIVDQMMHVINKETLQTFSLENASEPKLVNEHFLGFNLESLLHYKGSLFIGSPQAMYIYKLSDEGIPQKASITSYLDFADEICRKDPIAANESHAYASLSVLEFGECSFEDRNEIRVFDISDLKNPVHINSAAMESPRGVSLDGNVLFVCEANNGLKVLDISNPMNIETLYHFEGFKAFDVVANDGSLVVVGPDKIYEYDYSDINNMRYLSEIDI